MAEDDDWDFLVKFNVNWATNTEIQAIIMFSSKSHSKALLISLGKSHNWKQF